MTRKSAVALTAKMGPMLAALALVGGALSAPASAIPFANCDQAEAAGFAPIFVGQPGYSSNLDRDGDGVACEQGTGRPVALAPPTGTRYLTTIGWQGPSQCIEVIVPNFAEMQRRTFCSPEQSVQFDHTALPGQVVGGDPIMGSATVMSCFVITYLPGPELISSTAMAGDGNDVNCIVTV